MKAVFAAALIALAALPARAHHEAAYGLFWKDGRAPGAHRIAPEDVWRYAFVSKLRW